MSSDAERGGQFRFMDCNCRVGDFEAVEESYFTDLDGLLAEMDYLGIAQALVMHTWASRWSPRLGNEKLDETIADEDNLYPCYVALPSATDELAEPGEFATHVREQNGAVRLFPADHQWDLADWCADSLLAALDAEAVTTLIDIGQTNWSQVAAVLERYTKLPLIIMATSYRINRHIYPLFEKYDNLYLESHTYQTPWGIEDISRRFGADRLIFGTSLPEMEGGAAIGQVLYADLSAEDKAKIAGGNLRRLLGI